MLSVSTDSRSPSVCRHGTEKGTCRHHGGLERQHLTVTPNVKWLVSTSGLTASLQRQARCLSRAFSLYRASKHFTPNLAISYFSSHLPNLNVQSAAAVDGNSPTLCASLLAQNRARA